MTLEKFTELFNDLSAGDRIAMFNEYCYEHGDTDNAIQSFDEEFFDTYFDDKMEICRATCYGDVNFMDPYIRFNAYGNLESFSETDALKEVMYYVDDIFECEDVWSTYITDDEDDEEDE